MEKAWAEFTIKSADPETGTIVGWASTPQTDRVGDVMVPEGATYSLPVPLLFSHDHNQPVGAVTAAEVTAGGIRVVAKLALEASDRVRECWELIKAGALRGLSVGFIPKAQEPIPGGGYRFTSWDWHELSVCAVPANAGATISNIKHYAQQPVSALGIKPKPSKEGTKVTIHERTALAENVVAGAVIQWMTRAKAFAAINGCDFGEAADRIGAPTEIARRIKAAAESTATQPGLAGESAEVRAFISQASESSIMLRMIAERETYQLPLRTPVYLPDVDMTAQVIGEGQPIPFQGFDLNRTVLDSFKIAGGFAVTEELVQNISSAGQAFLNTQLRAAVAKAADLELFTRLTDGSTLELTTDGTAADMLLELRTALAVVCTKATDRPYFAFSPAAATWVSALEGLPDTCDVYGGRFLNRPAAITEGLTGMRIGVVNGRSFAGAVDRIDISASNTGTVELLDEPTNDSLTPTGSNQMISLFMTNTVAVKVVANLACEPIRANGVAFVDIDLGSV